MKTTLTIFGAALSLLSTMSISAASTLTFTPLQNPPATADAMWLMQDGTVLVELSSDHQTLAQLSPDASGSYVSAWPFTAGSFLIPKNDFASAVLSDGRLVTCGGEHSGNPFNQTETNFCEIYDPISATSTSFQPPPCCQDQCVSSPVWTNIGDAPSAVLPDGSWLIGNTQGYGQCSAVLNPSTLAWTLYTGDSNNEQGYTLLQNGDVLSTHVYDKTAWRFDLAEGGFVQDTTVPLRLGANHVNLGGQYSGEIGPSMTLRDGRVIWFGATGHTAIYTPGATGVNGSWVAGPDLPVVAGGQLIAADSPALLEPSGRVLLAAFTDGPAGPSSATMLEFMPEKTAFEIVTNAPTDLDGMSMLLLILPNGHGLLSNNSGWYDVTFNGGGNAGWAPTITSFPSTIEPGATVQLSGTQLAGRSECSMFGDDNQQSENYPNVQFTDANGLVSFARAHDVSTRSIHPHDAGSVSVDIPGLLPLGPYTVQVVTCGIPSAGVTAVAACPTPLRGCIPCPGGAVKVSCPYYGANCEILWSGCY